MNSFEVANEPDWPAIDNKRDLVELDHAAQCSICHDFFDTPLSLPCGHSFCANCIRSNLQYQERNSGKPACPQCRQAADSREILPNHQLRELVKRYLIVRPILVSAASKLAAASTAKRKKRKEPPGRALGGQKMAKSAPADASAEIIALDSSSEPEAPQRKLRARSKPVDYYPKQPLEEENGSEEDNGGGSSHGLNSGGSEQESGDSESCPDSQSEGASKRSRQPSGPRSGRGGQAGKLPRNWAECPCCTASVPLAIFNDHLDRCLANGGASAAAQKGGKQANGAAAGSGRPKPQLAVPPKLLLAIEKDKALRDRLKKYHLSTKGTRKELEQRYDRFRVEVQTAIDRHDSGATYARLAARVMSKEASAVTAAAGPSRISSLARSSTTSASGSKFDDLIKATKLRASAPPQPAASSGSGSDSPADVEEAPRTEPNEGGERQEATGKPWGRGFRRGVASHRAQPPLEATPAPSEASSPPVVDAAAVEEAPGQEEPRKKILPWSDSLLGGEREQPGSHVDVVEDSEG